MFRFLSLPTKICEIPKCFANIVKNINPNVNQSLINRNIGANDRLVCSRPVVYYTHSTGKFRSNKAVLQRFYRLNWGAWIRPRAGRHKHLWSKPYHIKWWTKQHVFCSDEHNKVLDQMVGAYWKTPTYFVDDPYEPYHKRHNFPYVPLGRSSVTKSYINILHEYKTND